jgi:CubicO group peptidase (beta-lactamase class C family)
MRRFCTAAALLAATGCLASPTAGYPDIKPATAFQASALRRHSVAVDVLARRTSSLTSAPLRQDPPCPTQPLPVALPNTVPAPIAAALASVNSTLFATLNATGGAPGFAASVWYAGEPLAILSGGYANVSAGTAPTRRTLFRVGSVSKLFPALLAYMLADAGAIDLDEPVGQAAPAAGFSVLNPFDETAVTFRHLLSQTSGLQRECPAGLNTTATVLAAVAETFLILPPGAAPSYSNLGFAVLGHVLGEFVLQGTDFPTAVAQYITTPLGMANTGFNYTASVMDQLAVG